MSLGTRKFLLTNDDGITAPGLAALANAVEALGEGVVVAPICALSGCSHRVTNHGPIRVEARGDNRFAVDGTPADCVRVGLHRIAPDAEWIIAGINAGGNLGADIHYSGTVAAVREAVLHGRPGIAVSHYLRRDMPVQWARAARWLTPLLRELMQTGWTAGTFWNINLPHLGREAADPIAMHCAVDAGPLPLSYREEGDSLHYSGNYHQRTRERGKDVDVCFEGNIAVSKVAIF